MRIHQSGIRSWTSDQSSKCLWGLEEKRGNVDNGAKKRESKGKKVQIRKTVTVEKISERIR